MGINDKAGRRRMGIVKNDIEEKNNLNKNKIEHWQWISLYLFIYDIVAVSGAYFCALWLRFDLKFSMIPKEYLYSWAKFAPFYVVFAVLTFKFLRLYRSIWRFASFKELQRVTLATIITGVFHTLTITLLFRRMPISYYLVGIGLQYILILGIRFSYRYINILRRKSGMFGAENCMIIGAGEAGSVALREIGKAREINERVVCIIDDNKNKWNRDIDGIPVVGGRESIVDAAEKYKIRKIYIAIPSASAKEKKEIVDICQKTACELKTLPGMYQLMLGNFNIDSFRDVEVEDLLGREPVNMNPSEVRNYLDGKTVLVTGGGGSIGSELCRQIAAVEELKRLIVFDMYENNAHEIKLKLTDNYPELDLVVLVGSVRNYGRVEQIFRDYRPDIVFHAAAHKHVPLMEDSPCEAIKNNVIGTYNTAYAAMIYGCEKFLLISTDKAVNPVNIMGASKRLCEMIIQTFARKISKGKANEILDLCFQRNYNDKNVESVKVPNQPETKFVAVRFGNVLGSNGSVIPRFKAQIAAGGPVTVTHPEVIRYFMTTQEAVSLVLVAATFGGEGNIFVLDMGTPVKIDDMARNMIKLSGLKPDEDIKIIYTGLRTGEKLFEERLMDEEGLTRTKNELINIGRPIAFNEDKFLEQLNALMEAAYDDRDDIREITAEMVDTYKRA